MLTPVKYDILGLDRAMPVGAKLMQAINYLELVLIELEYAAADCLYRETSASDPSEQVDLDELLPKIRAAKVTVLYALDSMQGPSDRGLPQAV
jgi:hypothetical protein